MSSKKDRRSTRQTGLKKDGSGYVPIDQERVSRRIRRHLDDLERTNYVESKSDFAGPADDPAEALDAETFRKTLASTESKKRRKKSMAVRSLLLYRKSLATLIDESGLNKNAEDEPSYVTAPARPSTYPPLTLCSVCSYNAPYTCVRCGQRFCGRVCKEVHDESRCH